MMYTRNFLILLTLSYSLSSASLIAQSNINRYKNKLRQGVWIVYSDSTKTKIDNIGRYRKGVPKGKWKYFDSKGKLTKTEFNFFNIIHYKYFYQNGELKKKGKAKVVITDNLYHYFYYGKWLVYDSLGHLSKKQYYKEGKLISEQIIKSSSSSSINDSLTEAVRGLYKMCYAYTDSLTNAESKYGKNSNEYKRISKLNYENGSTIVSKIDKLINDYGYPGKTLVGTEYATVFSIISTCNLEVKKKHFDVIVKAADKGELDWMDVAFFVDKVMVAKKEKQVYGTQSKITKNHEIIYYPILDKQQVNERRHKVGLDELDINTLNDSLPY